MFGDNRRLRKHLSEHGQQAEAKVLEAKKRPWTAGPASGGASVHFPSGPSGPMRQVYRLKLRVKPTDEPAFEVEISDQPVGVPEVGMTLPVLFDPKHHSKVVLALDPEADEDPEADDDF